jgi:hypothetical protein
VVEHVDDDPVRPGALVGARGAQELGEGRGEAVEALPEELELILGNVVSGLGALGEAFDARERQGSELEQRRGVGAHGRQARDVARRGDEGHAVAPRRQALSEVQEREQVPECEPWADHQVQRRGGGGAGVHVASAYNLAWNWEHGEKAERLLGFDQSSTGGGRLMG